MDHFANAVDTLRELIDVMTALVKDDANEAATRLHIIDRVIFDVCMWPRGNPDAVRVEERVDSDNATKRFDYLLTGFATHSRALVEAKRINQDFAQFAAEAASRKIRLIRYNSPQLSEAARDALDQVANYGFNLGVGLVVATNGTEWIFMKTFVDGVARKDLPVAFFSSIEAVIDNVHEFLTLLSYDAVSQARYVTVFDRIAYNKVQFAQCLTNLWSVDAGQPENEYNQAIRYIMGQFFGRIDLPDRQDMLEQCYVWQHRSKSYNSRLEAALKEHVPGYVRSASSTAQPLDVTRDGAPEFEDSLHDVTNGEIVLIVGNVGVGKSTFIRRFFDVVLPGGLKERLVVAIVDFNEIVEASGLQFDVASLRDKVSTKLLEDLGKRAAVRGEPKIDPYEKSNLRGIHSAAIKRSIDAHEAATQQPISDADKQRIIGEELRRGRDEPLETIKGFANYLKGTLKAPLCVAIDNVDHRSHEFERFVYRYATELATISNCVCLVSMREDTYYRGQRGFLDTRNDPLFLIRPPALSEVISKRVAFARTVYSADAVRGENLARKARPFSLEQILDFVEMVQEMFLGQKEAVRQLVEVLSRRSVREAFKIMSDFAVSGHIDISRMIVEYNKVVIRDRQARRYRGEPRFFSNVLRALMLGPNRFYRPQQSRIQNIYGTSMSVRERPFLKLRILQRAVHAKESERQAYFRGEWLCREIGSVGLHPDMVKQHFAQLVAWNLVDPKLAPPGADAPDDQYEISALGVYYLDQLAVDFTYLQIVSEDVVFYSKDHFDVYLAARQNREAYGERKARGIVDALVNYLTMEENDELRSLPLLSKAPWAAPFADRLRKSVADGYVDD